MDTENNISMLPQPTRTGGHFRALSEVSASDNNTRSAMPHTTAATGHKRHGSQLPEPAAKRKTLVERAGEPIKHNMAPPQSSQPIHADTSSYNSLTSYRSASSASTTSFKGSSNASRTTSNSSFSSAIGHGLKAPSIHTFSGLARPKTALAKDRKAAELRPTTSLAQNRGPHEVTKSKSMVPFSYSPVNSPRYRDTPHKCAPRKAASFAAISSFSATPLPLPASRRDLSMLSKFQGLSLQSTSTQSSPKRRKSPSRLPVPVAPAPVGLKMPDYFPRSPSKSPQKYFLTKDSNLEALDVEEHYNDFKQMFQDYQNLYKDTLSQVNEAKDTNGIYKAAISKLEEERSGHTDTIISLTGENETFKYRIEAAQKAIADQRAEHEAQFEELKVQFRRDLDDIRQEHRNDLERLKADHREESKGIKQRHEEELEVERGQRIQALSQASTQGVIEKQKQQMELEMKDHELRAAKMEIVRLTESLEREKVLGDDLRRSLTDAGANAVGMESARQALQAKIDYLQSDSKSQSEAYAEMERRMTEAIADAEESKEKLRKEETVRRKLHNQIQELKGNIRVFCRVRPTLPSEEPEELARMRFPDIEDSTEIEVKGPDETSSLGKITTKTYPFAFDRVFDPTSNNNEIFDEISQLIQSALDGYNVCIFAYGQTGSGKTYTMSSDDGMIPRALRQIYSTSKDLEEKGWTYTMEGSFVEVYNEEIRDLLGKDVDTNKKHEIRHDMAKLETTITDVQTVMLDSQSQVEGLLAQAMAKRSVAATKANERSSRSHSIFILKLKGHNTITGERSKGTLNLVDLAGSERLSHSKVEGQRLKETQSINKSLSCLGDVIGALGQPSPPTPSSSSSTFDPKASTNGATTVSSGPSSAHIPYRNSKLTYLLQFSLGGNSKTLMFVMVAPEKKCLSETITSLKFAEKVGRTKVGVAKKTR